MRILGLDVGSKTIGVAVSDALGLIAQALTTIYWNEEQIHSSDESLGNIIKEYDVGKAIIGYPKNMDGTIGERGKISKGFATHLESVHQIKTILWDERLSTMAAERTLLEADMSRQKRAKVIDQVAAVMILQNYLDTKR